ncbi:MAG: hypothetical protein NXH75_12685 [Halobacteriovoraceae bacterium]|nr:hypothetical protein [Halobacteriovoraceae bacterium]
MLFKFFRLLFSLFPDLSGFKELGFEVKTYNGELFVERNTDEYSLKFSQGFEPFSRHILVEMDFDIPDGFFVLEFHGSSAPLIEEFQEELSPLFRFHKQVENYWFLYDKSLDFSTPQIGVKVEKLIKIIDQSFGE